MIAQKKKNPIFNILGERRLTGAFGTKQKENSFVFFFWSKGDKKKKKINLFFFFFNGEEKKIK